MKRVRYIAIILWLAILIAPAHGQIMDNPGAAEKNTIWLQNAVTRGFVQLPVGTLYIKGTAKSTAKVGCLRVESWGAKSYPVNGHPILTGRICRVVQLGKGPIFDIQGGNAFFADPFELVGDSESAAIQIRSGNNPNTGGHYFGHLTFQNWGAAFRALGDEKDPARDQHADNTIVNDCHTFNCRRFLWSQNQQAMNWKLRDCSVNGLGKEDTSVVVADVERGGHVLIDSLVICHTKTTLFKVRDFSPNTMKLICRDFQRDRFDFPDDYLTVFEYAGPPEHSWTVGEWFKHLEVTGTVAVHYTRFDRGALYRNVPRDVNAPGVKIEPLGDERK